MKNLMICKYIISLLMMCLSQLQAQEKPIQIKEKWINRIAALEIDSLVEVQYLYWGEDSLRKLPPSLFALKNLKGLDLSQNFIKKIPRKIRKLRNLEVLKINQNGGVHHYKAQKMELMRAKYDLKDAELANNPTQIDSIEQVMARLEHTINQFKPAPASIKFTRNKSIKVLYLSDNLLTQVPKSIKKLKALETIYLSRNQLGSIPAHLKRLKVISLEENQIKDLSTTPFHKFKKLTQIILTNNFIEQLPDNFCEARQLQKINFALNPLKQISPKIGQLSQLESILFYKNQLTILPESFFHSKISKHWI